MAVLRPLKVVIENYPEGQTRGVEAVNNPEDPAAGKRKLPFRRELYIEQDDFLRGPAQEFLPPGARPRGSAALRLLRHLPRCGKNAAGEIIELRCTYDPATHGGNAPDGRKVKATIHWVSAPDASWMPRSADTITCSTSPTPDAANFVADLKPQSLEVLSSARIEPAVAQAGSEPMQFERLGYFVRDRDSRPDHLVFNRTIGLRDTFAKEIGKG